MTNKRRSPGELSELVHRLARTETDECLMITGHKRRPTAYLNGTVMNASRAAWIIVHGDPGDLNVNHTCHRGMEGCVNVRHMYVGTQRQNLEDMDTAGRRVNAQLGGSEHWNSKLTEEQVAEIRSRYTGRGGITQTALAQEYGLTQASVSQIVLGRRRSENSHRIVKPKSKRLTDEERRALVDEYRAGATQVELAVKYGVSQPAVSYTIRKVAT